MFIAVTGGTGFLGGHTVAALRQAGHSVRLLVRDGSAVPSDVDVVYGDVRDPSAVEKAVRGADAVLHAAGVYSFDGRRKSAMAVNVEGTSTVLDAAAEAGVGRVVHVSTVGALFGPGVRAVGPDSPVGSSREPYLASKMAADRLARSHQDRGLPVVIAYPPALLGPGDGRVGDQTARLRAVLRGLMPVWPRGGFGIGDVRDSAAATAALFTGSPDPRHFLPGEYLTTGAYLDAVRAATGRALPALRLPGAALAPVGALADAVQRLWPWQLPVQRGAITFCRHATEIAAPPGRPFTDTVADTVTWLRSRGLLTDRQAGAAA